MRRVGIRQLQQHASAVVRDVKAGEVIEVTERGEAVARLVPVHGLSRFQQMVAAGLVRPARQGFAESMRLFPPLPAESSELTASEALRQLREHER